MRKGISQSVAIVLILLAVGGFFLWKAGKLPFAKQEVYQGCDVKSGLGVIPLMGYYKCEQMAETQLTKIILGEGAGFITPDYQEVKCDVYAPYCRFVSDANYCEKGRTSCTFIGRGSGPITVQNGESIWYFRYYSNRYVTVYFSPYTLYNYAPSVGRERVYQTEYKCSPPVEADLCLSADDCPQGTWKGALDFDQSTNYLDKWAMGPVEYNFVDYQGGKAYCSGSGNIYSINTLQFESGCYVAPASFIKKEDCCPGAISGNLQCGTDFKWSPLEQPSCVSDFQCPGQGQWLTDYSDINRKTLIKYACQNGQCNPEKKTTNCATDQACPTGTLCMIDQNTGVGNCVTSGEVPTPPRTPGILCTDGKTVVTDPNQCPKKSFGWMFPALAALLSFLILGGKDIKKRDWVGVTIAGIIAVMVFLVAIWLVKNLVSVLVGSVIGIFLGGALLYFAGGAILTVIIILMLIIRNLKGD